MLDANAAFQHQMLSCKAAFASKMQMQPFNIKSLVCSQDANASILDANAASAQEPGMLDANAAGLGCKVCSLVA